VSLCLGEILHDPYMPLAETYGEQKLIVNSDAGEVLYGLYWLYWRLPKVYYEISLNEL
jgi:hypothetical protein